MEIRPILSALMRSKVALILIGVQIALTLAIVCNSLFIINQRLEKMGRPSGMNETDTFMITSMGFGTAYNVETAIKDDVAMLRNLPGVAAAAPTNTAPLSNSGWSEGVRTSPEQKQSVGFTAIYFGDEHAVSAFGTKLVAGRNFRPEEITFRGERSVTWPSSVLMTKAQAEKLWPGQDPVGKQLWLDENQPPMTVIGIVERLQVPWPNIGPGRLNDSNRVEYSLIVPQLAPFGNMSRYMIRAEPGRRNEVLKLVEAKMIESNKSRIVRDAKTMEEIRGDGYREDRSMTIILLGVITSLLTITALGIVGMASFWVTQRTKQIGTRRALGATRGAILRYFLTENFIITTLGLILGSLLTYGFNYWLMTTNEGQVLPMAYLLVGVLSMWVLGQLAVLGPATRASRVPPAVATRSV
ncbi:ABC transporter permease [Tahibacter amnicola]|uniref:ABC transporter permease n=1 Tax=Tahibacter amnicola TaxID=2976241 RepID=A0ABY6BCL2_9GAMM|nr:FtsX-like permease family protein [Tahibacter amnicola]UXI67575.1 ABC transporter permease [Tahibacter amnicola]